MSWDDRWFFGVRVRWSVKCSHEMFLSRSCIVHIFHIILYSQPNEANAESFPIFVLECLLAMEL